MASPSPAKSLKVWLIVILGIAAVCVVAMVLLYGQRQTGGMVQITQNGTVVGTYPLDQDTTLRVDSDNGGYNLVVIEKPHRPGGRSQLPGPGLRPPRGHGPDGPIPSPACPTAWWWRWWPTPRPPSWTE